jgi:hypothetical protein
MDLDELYMDLSWIIMITYDELMMYDLLCFNHAFICRLS